MQGHIREMAALLQGMGRGGDTILAHINPQEAMLLDAVTDGGSINPVTGMPEFMPGDDVDNSADQGMGGGGGGQEMDDFDDKGYAFADEHAMSMSPSVSIGAQLGGFSEDHFSPSPGTQGVRSPVPGTLSPQSKPSFLGALFTAPFEIIPNIIGLDFETTGRDVLDFDLSMALAGVPGQQPAMSVEVNPAGVVGGAAADLAGALLGSTITPTINVDTSGNVTTHGGIGNTIDQVSDFIADPPDIVDEIANALGITATPTDEQQIASNASPSPLSGTMSNPNSLAFADNEFAPLGSPMTMPPDEPAANMTAISTMPQEMNVNQVTQTAGIPNDYFEESNDPFFQTPLQMTSPQQVAEQIIAQQELVNALTQPGYTRAGQGRIYL